MTDPYDDEGLAGTFSELDLDGNGLISVADLRAFKCATAACAHSAP